jgi:hypothetical protein
LWGIGVGLLVLLGGIGFAAYGRVGGEVVDPLVAAPREEASTVTLPVEAARSKAEAKTVLLEIRVEPISATLTLDDEPLGKSPFRGHVPRDAVAHVLRVSAHGHRVAERSIPLMNDLTIELVLPKLERPEPLEVREPNLSPTKPSTRAKTSAHSGRRMVSSKKALAPGMDLAARPQATPRRQIDVEDPYAP